LAELAPLNTNIVDGPICGQGLPMILDDGSLHIEPDTADSFGFYTTALGLNAAAYPKLYGPYNALLIVQDINLMRKH
jgi:hypothetical protein